MTKNNNLMWWVIGIIAIGLITTVALFMIPLGEDQKPFFAIPGTGANLLVIYQDFDLANLETTCKTANGDWTATPSVISCTEFQATIDCTTPQTILARSLCQGAGANWTCDAQNVICEFN